MTAQTITIVNQHGQTLATVEAKDLRDALEKLVMRGANLDGANLDGANLRGANLGGANLDWQSHDLIAEILRRAAGANIEKRKVAGLILISRDWCWSDFLKLNDDSLFGWALDTLAAYVRDEDGAPDVLRGRVVA